jgi:RNA polymerase sigma-70 factor (ECF subfamily)
MPGSNLIDIKLIEECRNGNLKNFRRVLELTTPFAYAVAFRMLCDDEQAKDVVQDSMIAVWQKLGKIKSAESYKTWIYRIVVNKCYDILRKKNRNPEFMPDEKSWSFISNNIVEGSSHELENKETAMIINSITNSLSPKQKAVFLLCEIEQLSHDEVSEITGLSKSAVKANLHYAKRNISEKIKKYI